MSYTGNFLRNPSFVFHFSSIASVRVGLGHRWSSLDGKTLPGLSTELRPECPPGYDVLSQ